MAALDRTRQAAYAGWQGAFFNASKFLTLGVLVVWAGQLERSIGVQAAWSLIFVGLAGLLAALAAWNAWALPGTGGTTAPVHSAVEVWHTLREVVLAFLRKPQIGRAIVFIVLFRFAEGQVQTIGPLFLLEPRERGGLGLSTEQMGAIYGGVGTLAFLVGSILGGAFAARLGLRRAMWVLILAMGVPNAVFAWLGHARPALDAGWALPPALAGAGVELLGHTWQLPERLTEVTLAVAVEMAGYGFGFVGMILYLMQAVAPGPFQTAHYALGTGVMQLGFILSKTISGDLQAALGYERFFDWTVLAGLPALAMLAWVRLPAPEPR
jgi:PAT family beta-lactamase induction signal transducer AmpG